MSPDKPRIALGSLFIECNQLGGSLTDLACFERCELSRGEEIAAKKEGVVGGMLKVLREREATTVPLLVATACPGGVVTSSAYHVLKTELLDRLRAALPVDGLLLALHGAAAAVGTGDLEGDLLAAVRQISGPELPIVATLDLHAHLPRSSRSGIRGPGHHR